VAAPPERFASLVDAARAAGMRVGWLELAAPAPLPPTLESAAASGMLRAVATGEGKSAAVKRLRGAPVLADLLREHFAGCALVLVHGEIEAPLLDADGDSWRVSGDGTGRRFATAELIAELRRPHPFAPRAS
jgi:hypothetical protein